MHKECLETYNDLIIMLFCFFVYLLDSISIIEIAIIELYLHVCHHAVITTYMTN